jgi:hypothetical protein
VRPPLIIVAVACAATLAAAPVNMPPSPAAGSPLWTAAGAFLGVFLGFLFARLGEFLKTQHERGRSYRSALERLYNTANEYINDVAEMINRAAHAGAGAQRGALSWIYPCELPIDRSYYEALLDAKLVDLLITFNIMLARYNRMAVDVRQSSIGVQDAYVAGKLPEESWREFLRQQGANLDRIRKFLSVVDDRVRDLAVRSILLKAQFTGRRARLFRMIGILRLWPLEEAAVDEERRKFDRSIAESRKRNVEEAMARVASIEKP